MICCLRKKKKKISKRNQLKKERANDQKYDTHAHFEKKKDLKSATKTTRICVRIYIRAVITFDGQ